MPSRPLALCLLALALSLPLLPSCERSRGSATPQAALELAELRETLKEGFNRDGDSDLQAEIAALLAQFDKTADAKLASSPHRITLLHLAAVYKKTELARCLLLDGADVNARQLSGDIENEEGGEEAAEAPLPLEPADTPLTWATIPHHENATAEELLPLIRLLVENGADVNLPGTMGMPPLVTACFVPSPAGEQVVLCLLELGARPGIVSTLGTPTPMAAFVAERGWTRALAAMLDAGAPMATDSASALHAAASAPEQEGALECARLLLERGAAVNALNEEGATPLYITAHAMNQLPEDGEAAVDAACAMISLLMQHGADALLRCNADPELPASCPADFIAAHPVVQKKLAALGVSVPRPQIDLAAPPSEAWLTEICRASLFGMPGEEVKPHTARLTALLVTPGKEERMSQLYADACAHAVVLLTRADAVNAADTVAKLPLWRDLHAWRTGDPRCAALMRAILDTPELVLPRTLLLEHARSMDAAGVPEVAAQLVEMLERDRSEGAEEEIEALCAEGNSLALRAGALTARLLRAGLPAPRNAAVAEWMEEHGIPREGAPAAVQRALLLTSLDSFWYGSMPKAEVDTLLQAMRDIEAPRAAAFYTRLAANLDKPEELDKLTQEETDTARYELECATALFIWEHRAEFLQAVESARKEVNSGVDKGADLD